MRPSPSRPTLFPPPPSPPKAIAAKIADSNSKLGLLLLQQGRADVDRAHARARSALWRAPLLARAAATNRGPGGQHLLAGPPHPLARRDSSGPRDCAPTLHSPRPHRPSPPRRRRRPRLRPLWVRPLPIPPPGPRPPSPQRSFLRAGSWPVPLDVPLASRRRSLFLPVTTRRPWRVAPPPPFAPRRPPRRAPPLIPPPPRLPLFPCPWTYPSPPPPPRSARRSGSRPPPPFGSPPARARAPTRAPPPQPPPPGGPGAPAPPLPRGTPDGPLASPPRARGGRGRRATGRADLPPRCARGRRGSAARRAPARAPRRRAPQGRPSRRRGGPCRARARVFRGGIDPPLP